MDNEIVVIQYEKIPIEEKEKKKKKKKKKVAIWLNDCIDSQFVSGTGSHYVHSIFFICRLWTHPRCRLKEVLTV